MNIIAKLIFGGGARGFYEVQTMIYGLYNATHATLREYIVDQLKNHPIFQKFPTRFSPYEKQDMKDLAEATGLWIQHYPAIHAWKKIQDDQILRCTNSDSFVVRLFDVRSEHLLGEVYTASREDFCHDAFDFMYSK